MSEEKTAVEELIEFAKKTNREINYSDKGYVASGFNPRTLKKSHAVIFDSQKGGGYFINYSDMVARGDSAMYSGFFFPIDVPSTSVINVRQKNILDKLNPFLKQSDYKTQSSDFNSKVVFTENDERSTTKIFNNQGIQDLVLEIFNLDPRIKIGVNHIDVGIVPQLKNKSTLGIYILEQWLLEDALIEKLFGLMEKFKNKIQNKWEVSY